MANDHHAGKGSVREPRTDVEDRRDAMRLLALAGAGTLAAAWSDWQDKPAVEDIRRAETGLVMLRGRIGGDGAPFNFGEARVTRDAVRIGGSVGHGYVFGRDKEKARLAAIFDALWQGEARARVEREVLSPIRGDIAAADTRSAARTAATRVDFFTLVRGED